MKEIIKKCLPIFDILLIPFVYLAGWLLKNIRRAGIHKMPNSKKTLLRLGVFPIRDYYYEPQFNFVQSENRDRNLPGINWNTNKQLQMLASFVFADELMEIPQDKPQNLQFYMNNSTFEAGDAEYWYQIIRAVKPRRIFEIGSGNSTLMARNAIAKNRSEDKNYICKHVCIEPYEMPWLEKTNVSVVRKKVEDLEVSFFAELQENDILFIDSSHVIRPYGDVLFEYLELLPTLNKGVIVHIHDIFSPKNYPKSWIHEEIRFWNEQYLLEAFLSHNNSWEIIGAVNFLHNNYYEKLCQIAPFLTPKRVPGSFYIRKTKP